MSLVSDLKELAVLYSRGAISAEEFAASKGRVFDRAEAQLTSDSRRLDSGKVPVRSRSAPNPDGAEPAGAGRATARPPNDCAIPPQGPPIDPEPLAATASDQDVPLEPGAYGEGLSERRTGKRKRVPLYLAVLVLLVLVAGLVVMTSLEEDDLADPEDPDGAVPVAESTSADEGSMPDEPDSPGPDVEVARRDPPDGFVRVAGGSFMMGSPTSELGRDRDERLHRVTITRDFWMQSHEVTQGEWQGLMGNNPSEFSSCGSDCPVERVNWYEAVAYANALSDAENLDRCYTYSGVVGTLGAGHFVYINLEFVGLVCEGYRLPTEAEWEYAARAGTTKYAARAVTTTPRYCGPGESCLGGVAWYRDNSRAATHRVGEKQPNGWGLYDMLGNVYEWTGDRYRYYPSGAVTDPLGSSSGSHVQRGGDYRAHAGAVRSANRGYFGPDSPYVSIGFRLARTAP